MSSVFSPGLFVVDREAALPLRMPHPHSTSRSSQCHLAGKKGALGTYRLPRDFDPVIDTAKLLSGPVAQIRHAYLLLCTLLCIADNDLCQQAGV